MVLNNYWKAFQYMEGLSTSGGGYINTGMVKLNGDAMPNLENYIRMGDSTNTNLVKIRTSNIGAVIGCGTGTIAATDYSLFDDCTSDFANFSVVNAFSAENDALSQIVTISGMNNTADEITITEAGITKSYSEVESGTGGAVLFAKMLLSTPVTVPAGGSFQLSVKWEEK